jgi:hypothetical protein
MGDGLPAEVVIGLPRATIDQAASADTVIVLSGRHQRGAPGPLPPAAFGRGRREDLRWSSCRPQATSLTPYAAASLRYGPGRGHRRWSGPWSTRGARCPAGSTPSRPGRGPATGPAPARWWSSPAGPPWPRTALLVGRGGPGAGPGAPGRPLPVPSAPGQCARGHRHGPGPGAAARTGDPRGGGRGSPRPGDRFPPPGDVTPKASCGRRRVGRADRWVAPAGRPSAADNRRSADSPTPVDRRCGPGSGRWSCWGRPLGDFPDRRLASGPSTGPSSWWRWPRPPAPHRAGRRGAACGRGPRASGHHHQHRGSHQPAGPEAGPTRTGLARLDDRRRARRPPGR